MTIYELIKQLIHHDPNMEVKINRNDVFDEIDEYSIMESIGKHKNGETYLFVSFDDCESPFTEGEE